LDILVLDLSQYLPILLFVLVALGLSVLFVVAPMAVSRLTGVHNPTAEKLSEYECGFPAFEDAPRRFEGRFYGVGIRFMFFYPAGASLSPGGVRRGQTGWVGWGGMMLFLFILAVGLAYEWKKGALDWE
jgi:NADH-quinone oxidoreductase subunit A